MASSSPIPASSSSALRRGYWTREEDAILVCCVNIYGAKNWDKLAQKSGLMRKKGSSCRFRWKNYLRPGIKRESFTETEDEKILRLRIQGYKWAKIAQQLPGRTDNHIKNHYNSHLAKKALEEFQDVRDCSIPKEQEFQDRLHEILQVKDDKEFEDLIEILCGKDDDNNNNNNNPFEELQDVRDYSISEEQKYQEFQSFLHESLYVKDEDDDDNNNNPLN